MAQCTGGWPHSNMWWKSETCPLWIGSNSKFNAMDHYRQAVSIYNNIWNLQKKTAKLNSFNLHVSCLLWAGSVNFIRMGPVVKLGGSLWFRKSWSLSCTWTKDVNTVSEAIPVWSPVRYISDTGQYRCTVSGLPLFFIFINK